MFLMNGNVIMTSNESFIGSLLNCAPCTPSCLCALPIIDARLRSFTLPISALRAFFCLVFCCFSCKVRIKNLRKGTGPDFITVKVIKFASNVIDPHHYNTIMQDLEKNWYLEEPKTALVRPIFKKNERNKI